MWIEINKKIYEFQVGSVLSVSINPLFITLAVLAQKPHIPFHTFKQSAGEYLVITFPSEFQFVMFVICVQRSCYSTRRRLPSVGATKKKYFVL
jgi:hypothetical protein